MAANFHVFLSLSTIGLSGTAAGGGLLEVDALDDACSFLGPVAPFSLCFVEVVTTPGAAPF